MNDVWGTLSLPVYPSAGGKFNNMSSEVGCNPDMSAGLIVMVSTA
jgi:hypothetical protein